MEGEKSESWIFHSQVCVSAVSTNLLCAKCSAEMRETMSGNMMGMTVVGIVCIAVLIVGVMKRKMEWVLNIFMRSILGTIAIYFINSGLATIGIDVGVGINPVTVLTSGILGFPGLAAIYGIGFYQIL